MISLQKNSDYETYYMVADLHAMTTPFDTNELKTKTVDVVLDYLSAGLDPARSAIFIQSDLADLHAQLMFYLSSAVTVARMRHLPTFKEKIKQHPKAVTMALLNYPVLMAADILIYKAHKVPVGIDQEPHLEVAREIARKMNDTYGLDFPEPTRFATQGEYVPSLTGEGKMSKSVDGSFISLSDDIDTIQKRLAKVPTDSGLGDIKNGLYISSEAMKKSKKIEDIKPSYGVGSLLTLVELFQGKEKRKEYDEKYESEGLKYKDLKDELAEAIYQELKPIQERRKSFSNNLSEVEKILEKGAQKARKTAKKTVSEVREKMGIK